MSKSTVDAVVSKIRQEKDLSQFQSVDMDHDHWRVFVNKCRRELDLPIQKGDTVKIDDVALKLSNTVGSRDEMESVRENTRERSVEKKGSVRKNGVILDVHDGYGDEEVEVMLYKSRLYDREYMGSFEIMLHDDQGFWIEEVENMSNS